MVSPIHSVQKSDGKWRLLWPEWSHITAECSCASIHIGVKGNPVIMLQSISSMHFSQPLLQQSAGQKLFSLEGHPVHLESTAPAVDLLRANTNCTGTGWSSWISAIYWWYHLVGQKSRGSIWERESNNPQNHRIIKYLEGTHKHCWVLASYRTNPKSNLIPESIIQKLLELCQTWGHHQFPAVPLLNHLLVKAI